MPRGPVASSSSASRGAGGSGGDDANGTANYAAAKAEVKRLQRVNAALEEKYNDAARTVSSAEKARAAVTAELEHTQQELRTTAAQLAELKHATRDSVAQANARSSKESLVENGLLDILLELERREASGKASDGEAKASSSRDAPVNYTEQREGLRRRCNYDTLVVLDTLRASLRMQLAYKDDYEAELQALLVNMGAAGDSAQAQLQAKIDAKQHELEVAVSAKTVALRRLKELEYMKESVVAECNTIVESVKAENTQLLEAVKRYQRRNEELKAELQSRHTESRVKELRIKLLQAQEDAKAAEHAHRLAIQKKDTQHEKEVEGLNAQLGRTSRLAAQKQALEEEVERLQGIVNNLKRNTKFMRYEAALEEARKTKIQLARLRKEHTRTISLLRRAKVAASNGDKKIAAMKVEYNKLFRAVQQQARRKKEAVPQSAQELHEEADKNPYYAKYYREKLIQRDKEIAKLTQRVHSLMSQGIHQKGSIRNFQAERHRTQTELDRVRSELQHTCNQLDLTRGDLQDTQAHLVDAEDRVEEALKRRNRWISGVELPPDSKARVELVGGGAGDTAAPGPGQEGAAQPSEAATDADGEASDANAHAAVPGVGAVVVTSTADVMVYKPVPVGASRGQPQAASPHKQQQQQQQQQQHQQQQGSNGSSEAVPAGAGGTGEGQGEGDEEQDDDLVDLHGVKFAGDPRRRFAAAKREALRHQMVSNMDALVAARTKVEARRRREAATGAAIAASSPGRQQHQHTARPLSPPFAGARRSDAEVIEDLKELHKLEEAATSPTKLRGSTPVSRRRRPASAHSRLRSSMSGSASAPSLSVAKAALLQGRQTYHPPARRGGATASGAAADTVGSTANTRTQSARRRPASAVVPRGGNGGGSTSHAVAWEGSASTASLAAYVSGSTPRALTRGSRHSRSLSSTIGRTGGSLRGGEIHRGSTAHAGGGAGGGAATMSARDALAAVNGRAARMRPRSARPSGRGGNGASGGSGGVAVAAAPVGTVGSLLRPASARLRR